MFTSNLLKGYNTIVKKSSLLILGLSLALLVSTLDYIAVIFYLYWTTIWYDIPMHFLGGLTIGILGVLVLRLEERSRKSFAQLLVFVMSVGIAWEIFEYLIGATYAIEGRMADITVDLILDAVGAAAAYFIALRSRESF